MTRQKVLVEFFQTVPDDPRITSKHISLYLALIQQADENQAEKPIALDRFTLMQASKISGRPTYLKCLKCLHQFGYLQYFPAPHRYICSYVCLLESNKHSKHTSKNKNNLSI